ncbi:MAG: DUF4212 domain-containing protein [Bacteroidota bacterium]
MISPVKAKQYWKKNLQLLGILLVIWFTVSFGFGILLAEPLNAIRIGGFKLGFWFAQQGAIYSFIILVFVYIVGMNRLDKKFDVDEE